MLPRAPAEVAIEAVDGDYEIGAGRLHARSLNGPRFHDRARPLRTAMFLHGSRLGANHTLVERPARWLIARELFDQVILPDLRGSGASSVLARPFALDDQADDLRRLLDRMNIPGPLTVLGLDTGGPVGLALAGLDSRVECVVLVASGPQRAPFSGLAGFLLRTGLLRPLLNREVRRSVGLAAPGQANFDPAYDAHTPRQMATVFSETIKHIPAERIDSLLYLSEAETTPRAVSISPTLRLEIPILQLIGENDEVWGGELSADLRRRLPNLHRREVPGAVIHKDVYFKAEAYYHVLFDFLKEACPGVK